jgi:hypothetical protein
MGAASAEPGPTWPYRSEPPIPKAKDGGRLRFNHIVRLRGAFSYGQFTVWPPERKFWSYTLRTPYSYTLTDGQLFITGVQEFYVQGRRDLLSPQCDHQVEIRARLVPKGQFGGPTLIVRSIHRIAAAESSNQTMQPTTRRRTASLSMTNKLSLQFSLAPTSGG